MPYTNHNHQPRWAGGRSTPDFTADTRSAQMGKKQEGVAMSNGTPQEIVARNTPLALCCGATL
jgi:hypothetical protein